MIPEKIHQALTAFARNMDDNSTLEDGVVSIRIIGEFSAGKSRLVRELFSHIAPPELLPVSSPEKQTYLSLEVTYGPKPELLLVKREYDYTPANVIRNLKTFPDREALKDDDIDPRIHRLRLEVPEPRLILPEGDGGENHIPKRLFLIDTPGWNADDTEIENNPSGDIICGEENLALIYVSKINRLDHKFSHEQLAQFLDAFGDASFFDRRNLFYLITAPDCRPEEREKYRLREEERIHHLLTDERCFDKDDYALNVQCVDFKTMSSEENRLFRDTFWQSVGAAILKSDDVVKNWDASIKLWPDEYDIRPRLRNIADAIAHAETLLPNLKKDGQFLKNMNRTRLLGLNGQERTTKLLDAWRRQIDVRSLPVCLAPDNLDVPPDHPLSEWWNACFNAPTRSLLTTIETFCAKTERILREIPENAEIEPHLTAHLSNDYNNLSQCFDSPFATLCRCTGKLANETRTPASAVASAITMSLLNARYEDILEHRN